MLLEHADQRLELLHLGLRGGVEHTLVVLETPQGDVAELTANLVFFNERTQHLLELRAAFAQRPAQFATLMQVNARLDLHVGVQRLPQLGDMLIGHGHAVQPGIDHLQ